MRIMTFFIVTAKQTRLTENDDWVQLYIYAKPASKVGLAYKQTPKGA